MNDHRCRKGCLDVGTRIVEERDLVGEFTVESSRIGEPLTLRTAAVVATEPGRRIARDRVLHALQTHTQMDVFGTITVVGVALDVADDVVGCHPIADAPAEGTSGIVSGRAAQVTIDREKALALDDTADAVRRFEAKARAVLDHDREGSVSRRWAVDTDDPGADRIDRRALGIVQIESEVVAIGVEASATVDACVGASIHDRVADRAQIAGRSDPDRVDRHLFFAGFGEQILFRSEHTPSPAVAEEQREKEEEEKPKPLHETLLVLRERNRRNIRRM